MSETQMAEVLITPTQAKFHRILSDLHYAAMSYVFQDGISITEKDDRGQSAIEEYLRPALIVFSQAYMSGGPGGQCYYDPGSGQWICPGSSDY